MIDSFETNGFHSHGPVLRQWLRCIEASRAEGTTVRRVEMSAAEWEQVRKELLRATGDSVAAYEATMEPGQVGSLLGVPVFLEAE